MSGPKTAWGGTGNVPIVVKLLSYKRAVYNQRPTARL